MGVISDTSGLPTALDDAPLIIDTDIGGDADDALAVAAAVRNQPRLGLVLTNDETGWQLGYGRRARFARALLDAIGRADVATCAGARGGATSCFSVHGLVPDSVAEQPDTVIEHVEAVCAATSGPVRWVGMGAMGNLALVLEHAPQLAERLVVTQMGGALNYRDPSRAEHNIRMDVPAAHRVVESAATGRLPHLRLVTSDVTFTARMEVTAGSPLYRSLAGSDALWARMLHAHLDQWFDRFYPGTIQHDALALATALELPFADFDRIPIVLDEIGRMSVGNNGTPLWMSCSADHPALLTWLAAQLDPARADAAAEPGR